ncbi:MAG: DUF2877 domain-containing protein [Chloroflexi bacterium]|nr:DUF2877 domain-containing protein [Chloroflexota bacterium]
MLPSVALKCQLITPRAQRWLQACRQAGVLHLFDTACNLVDEQGRVLSLLSPRVAPGPFALVLDGDWQLQLDPAATVRVDRQAQRLYLNRAALDYGAARCWQPRADWAALRHALPAGATAPALPTRIMHLLQRLLDGICMRDLSEVREAARGLAGRGIGLTPSGDDVLMGVLYALWVWKPERALLEAIVRRAAPRTTTLSAAFLRAAAEGEASYAWHRLAGGDPGAIVDILATGHSSGREAWAAFVTTWTRLADERR